MNLIKRLMDENFIKYKNSIAFSFIQNDEVIERKYSEFADDIIRIAEIIKHEDCGRIAVIGMTSYMWVCTAYAVLLCEKTLIMPDATLAESDLKVLIDKSDAELIITPGDYIQDISKYRNQFKKTKKSINGECDRDNCEVICFTSGTSSLAKCVVLSQESLETGLDNAANTIYGENGTRIYIPIPTYHIFGFMLVMESLKKGEQLCFGRGIKTIKKDIKIFLPESIVIVPSIVEFLLSIKGIPDSVKHIMIAGSNCKMELYEKISNMGINMQNGYGLSEVCGGIAISMNNNPIDRLSPCEGTKFRIASDGEIVVEYRGIMKGYYKDEKATKEALVDGYFHTGDLGYIDDEGYLHVTGRKKDLIIMPNGEKVNSLELDAVIGSFRCVKEGAIIYRNDELCAVIVTDGTDNSENIINEQISDYNSSQPYYRRISKIDFRKESLARTSSGKLIRRLL